MHQDQPEWHLKKYVIDLSLNSFVFSLSAPINNHVFIYLHFNFKLIQ